VTPPKPCFACKSKMTLSADAKTGTCTNARCPGGGKFHYCGYCRDVGFSLVPEKMKCYNPQCRMFDINRAKCNTCGQVSIIPHEGRSICINRACPDNASIVEECFFCFGKFNEKSFLAAPDVMFCSRGKCDYLLRRVESCDICGLRSFVVQDSQCLNPECEIAGKVVEACPTCGKRTLARDAKGGSRCLNPTCAPQEQTTDEPADRTEQLPDYEPTLIQPPPKAKPAPATPQRSVLDNVLDTDRAPKPTLPPTPTPKPGPIPAPVARVLRSSSQPSPTPPPTPPSPPPAAPWAPARPEAGRPQPAPFVPSPAPTPKPSPAPPPPRSSLRTPATAIEEAYDLVRTAMIGGDGGSTANPLYLIIGLPGSGKTVYLTMLGAILGSRSQRFCFPYDGVEPNWVKVDTLVQRHRGTGDARRLQRISARIRDLVHGFGEDQHGRYITNRHWPPATAYAEEDDDNPATYFLVSEIVRNMRPVANVITLETSGEHYQEVLRNFQKYAMGAEPKEPTQRVLVDLMNIAEGFIVLIDPSNPDNDAIFRNFFMVLKECLRPRALNTFYRELSQGVDVAPAGQIRPDKMKDMRDLLVAIRRDDERRKRFEDELAKEKKVSGDRLAEIQKKLEAGRDETITSGEDGKWLEALKTVLTQIDPDLVKTATEKVLPPGSQFSGAELKKRLILYYRGLIRVCTDRLDPILRKRMEGARPPSDRSAILEIKKKYDLSDTFKIEIDESAFQERDVTHFQTLKYVSLVVTKSDKLPIIYPPERYAKSKLPGCDLHLRDIQDYLKLCGGQVRCYNASATGYTLLTGGSHMPGPVNTHTPINILEPLFEMMSITT